jgi:hypothetical protein
VWGLVTMVHRSLCRTSYAPGLEDFVREAIAAVDVAAKVAGKINL